MRRVIVAGTHSGGGKTTVSLALMKSLMDRGYRVAPYKVGPDYIDPGLHRAVCGRPSHNLDMHLMGGDGVCAALALGAQGADIQLVEGVMGYYDGMGSDFAGSTYDVALKTETPALLVVDAAGSSTSAAAAALGFLHMAKPHRVAGVIVNRASSARHYEMVKDALSKYARLPAVGWLKKDASLKMPSRHLGLIPAEEQGGLTAQVEKTASLLTMDWDAFEKIAAGQPETQGNIPIIPGMRGYRLGIARDQAFSFYYEANLMQLTASGAQLIPFSPLEDADLPGHLDGLYLGGGFPEVFAGQLEANASMRASIRRALEGGLACYAECGGMMYLSRSIQGREMVGFLPARCTMTERLQRFGYVTLQDDSGRAFPAHEFHHSILQPEADMETLFETFKASKPDEHWRSGYRLKNTVAGYPHLHFLRHPELAARLFKGDWP